MKFLILAPRFHTNLYFRCKALEDAGHKVKVGVLYKGVSEYYGGADVHVLALSVFSRAVLFFYRLLKKGKLKSSFELRLQSPGRDLRKVLKDYKPDIILLKAYQNLFALKTLCVNKDADVYMLTQTDKTHIKSSSRLFKLNIKLFEKLGVTAYITPIRSNYDAFKGFGIKNVYYLPFVFPIQFTGRRRNMSRTKLITTGKFQKRKDQLLLIKATEKLIRKGYDIELNIYGEEADAGYAEKMRRCIEQNSLQKRVFMHGHLPYEQMLQKYEENDIFVLPSYKEPAAYSIVEALCKALPVICSDQNGTQSYIKPGKNGYIFKAKQLNDLVEKTETLIQKKDSPEIIDGVRESAERNHRPEKFAEALLKIKK